jgi:hypothetical protein
MIASAIEEADQGTPRKEEPRVNECSPSFNFSDEDEECTIQKTIDGNIQHARLKMRNLWEFELFEPKLCVDYGRKKFDLATSANKQVNSIVPRHACRHKFKATDRWNRPETIPATKKLLDESGVVGLTCFHPVNLTFLNIYGGGERQSHGIILIEAVLHEVPHVAALKLCYDIACLFGNTLYRCNPDWMEVVEARIERFDIYGHEYRCHVLYNVLHTANYGLMVGQEPKHQSYMMQHLIRSERVSSSSCRMQNIDSFGR